MSPGLILHIKNVIIYIKELIKIAHYVICAVCGQRFDRDKENTEQVSARRYAHKACAVAKETTRKQEDIDKEELEKYIMTLLEEDYISPRVRKQLNTFVSEYKYTYSGMHKALVYFYEVKKNDKSKANGGIGIIPYCYRQAYEYYYSLWLAQQRNEGKIIADYRPQVREVRIKPPERPRRRKRHFRFLEEDDT